MRAQFNYFFVPPKDVQLAPQALPIFPSRLAPDEDLKISVKPGAKQRDWLKLCVFGLGVMTVCAALSLAYQYQKKTAIDSLSDSVAKATPTQTVRLAAVTPVKPPAPAPTLVTPTVPATAPVLAVEQQEPVAATAAQPMQTTATATPAPAEQPSQVTQEAVAQAKQLQTEAKMKPVATVVHPAPSKPPANKVMVATKPAASAPAPLTRAASATPAQAAKPLPPAEVPKFIIASENSAPTARPQQAGILKRPATVEASKPNDANKPPVSAAKQDQPTSQKLF